MTKSIIKRVKSISKPNIFLILMVIALAVLGFLYIVNTWTTSMDETSKQAMNTARTAEASFQKEALSKFTVSPKDIGNPTYESIKSNLEKLVEVNSGVRFAYIYIQKEGKIYFIADSESVDSTNYSPPGQEYPEADDQTRKPFEDGKPLITQPETDRWGTWVSVFVPMRDNETGKTIAVFGMDYPAEIWNNEAVSKTVKAGAMVFSIFMLLFAFYIIFNKNMKMKKTQTIIQTSEDRLIATQQKLLIANEELAVQNQEKEKRAAELIIINKELALQNKEISYISYHDFLTGLYNRMYFEEEKKRLDTPRQLPISIIMGDINGLKLINDGFGHSKGDELLVEIAKILKSCCRKEDIVSRIGGDEFVILLPKTDSQSAQQICDSIYDTCKGYALNESSLYPSISLGHATKNIETETMDGIFMDAEEHMSRHKLLESKSAHNSIISSIKVIMFEKSQETEEHAERLVQLSRSIGLAMSLTADQLNELELLSTLHDIGKMGIDAKILSKSGKLSDEEWAEMRKHPEVGFRIAQATSELIPIANYILCHHERWDGKGYPQGLIGEQIPLLSRIVAIVDSFDAMTNDRAYRVAMTKEEAIGEIRRNSGTQFDPEIARVFVEKVLGQEWEQLNKI